MPRRFAVPLLAPFLVLGLGACAAKVLAVGSGNGSSPPGSSEEVASQGSCTSASCANQSLTCVGGGAPTNLQCIPHPDDAGASVFTGTCILEGECTATGTTRADGSGGSTTPTGTASCVTTPLETCGSDGDGTQVCSSSFGGSGIVTVELDPASGDAGVASTALSAFFTSATGSTSTSQTFGACVFDPEGAAPNVESGSQGPAPNPGTITLDASGFDGSLYPACDGTYASLTSPSIPAAGSLVSLSWTLPAGNPWSFPASLPSVPAPHVVTLPLGDVFDTSDPTDPPIVRVPAGSPKPDDLAVAWMASAATGQLEEVVYRMTQGTAALTCAFPAADGAGTIPIEALLQLAAGKVSYIVYSQTSQRADDPDAGWQIDFAVHVVATSPNGLARGVLDLQ